MKKFCLISSFIILLSIVLSCNAAVPTLKFKISGLNKELLVTITARLQLKQEAITKYNDDSINTFYQEIPQEISKALETFGYFKSAVTSSQLEHKKNRWGNSYVVKLGPPIKIAAIDLKILGAGASDRSILKHLPNLPLKKGDIFRVDKYNAAKQFLFDLADSYGYATAFLSVKEVRIDLESNTAFIILHFDTDLKYYFGDTTFSVPFFSTAFLAKFLPYKSGESYSSKKIYALQESLSNSNYFQKITVTPQITKNQSYKIPVDVTLIPKKAKQYSLGVGYGTDTGFRGSAGFDMRYLTPIGRSLKSWIRFSQIQNELELHYLIPGQRPSTDLYDLNIAGRTLSLDNGKSLTGLIGAGYTTILKGWRQTIKLILQHEHYKLVNLPYVSSTLLIPSINWLHKKSNDPIRPTKGHSVNINIQGASDYMGASNSFIQTQVDAKYIKNISSKIQLLLRATLGFTAVDDIDNLPLSLQFYTGGMQSIRGFAYNSIGPGRNLAVGSIELRHQIIDDWHLAVFYDTGNTSNDLFKKPNQGAGIGIVWRTVIGTLELNFAKAISQPGTPGRIQFSLGTEL
ncbi:MAG: hypothetical protein ACD_69C00042G0001 [uncultured bacterium]|nr:MAG: hypothetical protein ACD_69C00042G0001 [uncultured bacterium]HBC71877.1 hypothetical protein [Coxiellaceae bacterium]HBY55717.1 hypothetical protein [Coxiellaceae bacterium]